MNATKGGEHAEEVRPLPGDDRGGQGENNGGQQQPRRGGGEKALCGVRLLTAVQPSVQAAPGLEQHGALPAVYAALGGDGHGVDGQLLGLGGKAQGAGFQQRAPQREDHRERRRGAHGVAPSGGAHGVGHGGVQRAGDAGDGHQRPHTRAAAYERHYPGREYVQTQHDHGQLEHQAHQAGDLQIAAQRAEGGQTQRYPQQRQRGEQRELEAGAQRVHAPGVVLRRLLGRHLLAQLLRVLHGGGGSGGLRVFELDAQHGQKAEYGVGSGSLAVFAPRRVLALGRGIFVVAALVVAVFAYPAVGVGVAEGVRVVVGVGDEVPGVVFGLVGCGLAAVVADVVVRRAGASRFQRELRRSASAITLSRPRFFSAP